MVGCCGKGGAQLSYREQNQRKCVTDQHDEEVCHGTGERRRDLIDQLKIFLNDFDERPCQTTPPQEGPNAPKPLGRYPEYMRKHCQSWMPPHPRPPLITSVQTHEVRPTEDYERMQHQNTEYVSYRDARHKPPPPTCDCVKRNGLQDRCPHPDCTPPTPECLATNPGPCCPPSLGMTATEAARGGPQTSYPQGSQAGPVPCCSPSMGPAAAAGPQRSYHPGPQAGIQEAFYPGPQRITLPPQQSGTKMICFCEATAQDMPSGKKYICCPMPR